MAAQPARPWFRLSSMARPAGAPFPAPVATPAPSPAPVATPAPAPLVRPTVRPLAPPAEPTPPPPAPLVRPTLRPLAPPPVEPTPPPAAAPTPMPPAAAAPTPTPPAAAAPTPTPPPAALTPTPPPAALTPTPPPAALTPTPPPAAPTPTPPAPLVRPTLRPLAPPPAQPTPTPPAAAAPTPAPPAPLVRPTLRPLAPPPAQPTPPPPAARAPTPSPAAATVAPPPAAIAPPPVVTSTTAAVPLSPARGVSSAPSAASPPATAIAITSTSSSVPPSPGNKVVPSSSSRMPSPRTTVTTSVPTFPATSRAVPPPQTSPPKPTATANSVPPQAYSPPKPRSTIISLASTAREPNPNDNLSLRTIRPANHTPPESPNRLKPTAPPPSPLNLPASQLKSRTADQTDQRIPIEAEQKTVLVQKTIDQKSNSWFSTGGSKQDRESGKPGIHAHIAKQEDKIIRKKLSSDSEEVPGMRVITLAGENKGAHMELIQSPNKHHEQRGEHSHYLYKKGNNGKSTQTIGNHESDKSYSSSSGEEGKAKMKDKIHHRGYKAGHSSQLPLSSFTNSNVQDINNSIMYNTSCTHHDPGVHIALARKPNGDGFDVKGHVNGRNS